MTALAGFWSYARADDEAEGGRIVRLARRIKTEYAMISGQEIDVFIDRYDLAWGDEWRRRIDEALLGTAFFIPVVTPRYFSRPECRKELLTFAGHASSLGVEELLLPLLYVDVPDLSPESSDEAVALIARAQHEKWMRLRLEDEDSAEYRKGVHELAARLVEIGAAVSSRSISADEAAEGTPEPADASGDEEPGFVELLAGMEEAFPRWQRIVEAYGPVTEEIGRLMERATEEVEASDARQGGFAGRLRVAAALGQSLSGPADEFLDLSSRYASELVTVDAGMLTLIRMVSADADDLEDKDGICELFERVKEFAAISRENYGRMRDFSGTMEQTASFSREVRAPIRKIQAGLQRIMDGQSVIDEWERQIEASGIDCSDPREPT